MIVKWNNNIVDYKCKGFFFFFFFLNATNPSFFLMLVYVIKKNISNGSQTRVSGAEGRRSNKERQRLQPLVSVGYTPPLLVYTSVTLTSHSGY